VAIHGFYQVLLAAMLVVIAAALTAKHSRSVRALLMPVSAALVAGGLAAYLVGLTYNRWLFWLVDRLQAGLLHSGHSYQDPQGALVIMVPYQVGLFVGLWVAWRGQVPWRRGLIGLALLLISQALVAILIREWATHTPLEPHVAVIRAWSVITVLLVGAWIVKRPRNTASRPSLSATEAQHG
jgi:cation transport ATPase